jgi:ABC-type nitrate/sulfonate/bicarbonate transport system substrate-binding protein
MTITKLGARPLVALVGALALVAACGDDGDATESEDGGASGDDAPAELQALDFHISWLPGGDNLAFWMGVEQGFFEAEGLDVTIRSSNDPTLSIKLAASGEMPLVQAYTGDVVISASQGEPVISLYALTDRSPFGIVTLPDSGITTAEQLAGETVGVTTLPIDRAFFGAMLESAGLSEDDVTVIDPGQGGVSQMITGNLAGTSAVVTYEPIILEAEGFPEANFIYYSDYGAPDAPFFNIVANPDWLAENEEVARAFLRGYQAAVEWTDENTTEAAEVFVEEFPDQDPELVAAIWEGYSDIGGTGEQDLDQWEELADFLEADGQLEASVDVTTIVSNDYLPG